MKLSELTRGTKILVPCVRCGYKRSITFQDIWTYRLQIQKMCYRCAAENRDNEPYLENFRMGPRRNRVAHEDMN